MTFKRALYRGFSNAVLVFGLLFFLAMFVSEEETPLTPQPDPLSEVEQMIADNKCWTGEAPAYMEGKLPGQVVFTYEHGLFLGGEYYVGLALDHLFGDEKHSFIEEVHAFCPPAQEPFTWEQS